MKARAEPAPLAPAPDDALPVLPEVQKAFWLRGDLAAGLQTLLLRRRARAAGTVKERDLLNEAVADLIAKG